MSFGRAASIALRTSSHNRRPSTLLCKFCPILVISSNFAVCTVCSVANALAFCFAVPEAAIADFIAGSSLSAVFHEE